MNAKTSKERAAAVAAYNEVVASADLNDITLIFVNFVVKPGYYQAMAGDDVSKLRRGFHSDFKAFSYDPEQNRLGGQFDWTIDVSYSRKKLLQIKASYVVTYDNVPDVGNTHIEAFIKRVGRFATYPYLRNLTSHLSWESRAELPVLPVLK